MNEYQSKLFIECLQSAGITETPIEWNDTLVKEFLLKKNLNYSYIYNQYLIIKYTFEYISLEKNINKYEQAYINFELTHTKKSSEFTIISNLEKIISEVINEYAIARYSILYKNIPHIALPLSLINFNCKVPQELMQDFLQKSTRAQPREQDSLDTLQQITFEKFKLNLKLATIFRCSLLQVTNNARHEPRVGLAAEVPYTDGTTMIINSLLFNLLNDAIFLNKLPDTKPTKLFYKKNLSICDLYDNKNYSYPLWTIKPKNRLTQAFLSKVNVMDKKIKLAELVHTINYLNCVQFVIDENFFFKLKQKIEAGKAFLKVTEYGNTTKSPKYMHTILDDALEITTDETYIADGIILKDCNDYLEFKLINTQIQRLLKYFNGSFYLRYILDNRTRVYVQQWPVNYQLNHFVRHIIKFKEVTSLYSIYRKFFYSKEYLEHKAIYKLWKSNSLDCSRLKEALSKHKVNFNVEPITHKNIPTEAELTQLLFIESMLTVLLSLAPKQVISPQEKITYISGLISQAPNLDNILDESNSLFTEIFNKQEISFLKKKTTLASILSKNMDDIWWADASSNALQLIVLAKGTSNNKLLQLLNLVDNQTNYINIYDYVADQLRMLDYSQFKLLDHRSIIDLVDLELVKYIAMPAAYGKTLWSCKKTIDKNLSKRNKLWTDLPTNTKIALCSYWYTHTFKILNALDLDLHEHINLCKKKLTDTTPIFTHGGIPIFTRTTKIFDRHQLRKKIHNGKKLLKELLQTIPGAEKFLNLNDQDLYKLVIQEQKNQPTESLNIDKYTQVLKLLSTIKTNKNTLIANDKHTVRVNVSIKKKYRFQFRLQQTNYEHIDIQKSRAACTANATHAYDASLLLATVNNLNELGIPCACIHDAIGCSIKYIPIAIYLYKYNLIKTIDKYYYQEERYFPYTINEKYQLSCNKYPDDILNAAKLFS